MASIVSSMARRKKRAPELSELPAVEVLKLLDAQQWCRTWNRSLPLFDFSKAKTMGKQAGRPSKEIERERGIVT